jgi:glycosyltransferase involved in cell wall biosynthesis
MRSPDVSYILAQTGAIEKQGRLKRGVRAKLYLNARFAGQKLTGVGRFAKEISARLLPLVERDGRFDAFVLAPRRPQSLQASVLWEQFVLPFRARGGFLVSLANTGPLALRRQLVVVCDASVFAMPENYSPLFRAWYYAALNVLLRRAERIVTLSRFSRAELARYCGVPESRIDVIPCGCDHVDAVTADDSFPERAGLARGRYVLAVGTPSGAKNLAVLGDAMARLRGEGLQLALAGNLEPSVFRRAPSGLQAVTLGYVTDGELKALYEQALCLAFPSRYEGFGLPPLEAMRCGCPVVASEAASLPEVCGDAALFAAPDDSERIARHIGDLAASEALRESLRARGRAHAAGYTWTAAAERLFQIIAAAA